MVPDFIDIHTHLNFSAFDDDRDAVIARTLSELVWAINVGTQIDTSRKAIELAHQHEGMFAAIGLHPIHTDKSFHDSEELGEGGQEFSSRGEVFDSTIYRTLAEHPKVVAIGECGLDYFRITNDEIRIRQEKAFRQQIELALEVNKPLMLHLRNGSGRSAYKDAFSILNSYFLTHNSRLRGDLHFFAGTIEEANPFLDIGFTFSFTGVVTFARAYDEVIKYLPADSIMAETDAPYVAPEPHRGKRNEPRYVSYVVEKLAHIKGLPLETMRLQILKNARRMFGI